MHSVINLSTSTKFIRPEDDYANELNDGKAVMERDAREEQKADV